MKSAQGQRKSQLKSQTQLQHGLERRDSGCCFGIGPSSLAEFLALEMLRKSDQEGFAKKSCAAFLLMAFSFSSFHNPMDKISTIFQIGNCAIPSSLWPTLAARHLLEPDFYLPLTAFLHLVNNRTNSFLKPFPNLAPIAKTCAFLAQPGLPHHSPFSPPHSSFRTSFFLPHLSSQRGPIGEYRPASILFLSTKFPDYATLNKFPVHSDGDSCGRRGRRPGGNLHSCWHRRSCPCPKASRRGPQEGKFFLTRLPTAETSPRLCAPANSVRRRNLRPR